MTHTRSHEDTVVAILTAREPVYEHRIKDLNDGIALAADFLAVLESIKNDCLRGAHLHGMTPDGVRSIAERIERATTRI